MKTLQVAIISFVALALSGCATGYYQRGYAGYGSSYSSPSNYQSYGSSYYSPGTSISYGRYYVQPSYRSEHHHDSHQDWRAPTPHFDRHDGGRSSWQNRDMGRREFRHDSHAEHAPRHEWSPSEQREHGFGRHGGDGDHQQRGGWSGRHNRHGE
ncbi:hypothetical protein QZJ86_20970 [Methylomonas montana]|uniref:hypothetical protein n=1 Tax=Methylomonas montana TaxID=3058963 RepID=UPI002658860F|nr:hypothetical protein [Methylomonas montana]WKJ90450.1 hypothetical protein QZJ86_20970 [Methylomonas montana]